MLILKIVVQAKTLGCEMFTDHRHPEVGTALAAELGKREAQVPGLVGETLACPSKSSHSWRGSPPRSKSVRAHSRR